MASFLLTVGAALTVIGLLMIPLPGPGVLVMTPGLILMCAGAVMKLAGGRRGTRSPSGP